VGVEEEDGERPEPADESRAEAARQRVTSALGVRGRVTVGIAFFLLYAISFSLRGEPLPGIVGGLLGGVLVYLVFKEVENRARRRRQR
jgi:hypothetical protein